MTKQHIERVDNIPLILYWLKQMRVQEIIDSIWSAHTNWQGLSYGQLVVLFLTYILHTRTHCLSAMEEWVETHRLTLEQATGWTIGQKEVTDDRLGRLLEVMGEDKAQGSRFQQELSQQLISAYDLPTQVVRYDTTTFNVHHAPEAEEEGVGVLQFGHSKDRRPDLLQFKQSLGTLERAGVPLLTATLEGNQAEDPLYVPAWREMVQTLGHADFLFVADSKAAALATRATIAKEGGNYLFPLPMTGDVPRLLSQWVTTPPVTPQPIRLPDIADEQGELPPVGCGFIVERSMATPPTNGNQHTWTEQWIVTQSTANAKRQRHLLQSRLHKAENRLSRLRPKKQESATDLQARAERIVRQCQVEGLLFVTVKPIVTTRKKYLGPGRPGPNRPYQLVEEESLALQLNLDEMAIEQQYHLAGWRIYVTNVAACRLPLEQAIAYYRDEWLIERGYHRFKKGSLPALPLFIRLPARIVGLM